MNNKVKKQIIEVENIHYARLPIRTHVITKQDNISNVAQQYAAKYIQEGDILFICEKAVACSQGRAIPLNRIHPSRLARILSRFVYKSPYGIGLGIPETMEMALREGGTIHILFAAFISAIGKLMGKRGWFYKIAGSRVSSIDGPTPYTLPPYNKCVVLCPDRSNEVAREVAQCLGVACVIVDVNDLGAKVLGASDSRINQTRIARILRDNPLGQGVWQTPMGIIRPLKRGKQT
ncbi:coenzyme F420-0:L-glutamate ligase [Sporanaerobacter sp. PP17-6a]|uniref:coenzyme F420-0:L-glutamate ligase n=1 Tax=Sporanaerobacter sp. PP17-6a TaxID=1891289 RepID=UPI0008A0137E|nr:coenzyme F420-0:L-glutamate ligase [Sporanaerobacter sp. PP17-6a]SCL91650.1 Asparagine synthase (glutamine-hydrolyzing) [Sporanaerobacter sp. PP17-6a]